MLSKEVFLISCMMVSLFPRASWAEVKKAQPETSPFMEMQDLFPKMGAPKIVVAKDGTVLARWRAPALRAPKQDAFSTNYPLTMQFFDKILQF